MLHSLSCCASVYVYVIAELHPGHYRCSDCTLRRQGRKQGAVRALQLPDHSHCHRHLWSRSDSPEISAVLLSLSLTIEDAGNLTNHTDEGDNSLFTAILMFVCVFFSQGFDTITAGLQWSLLYLIKFPHIQERIHQEIGPVLCSDLTNCCPSVLDNMCHLYLSTK